MEDKTGAKKAKNVVTLTVLTLLGSLGVSTVFELQEKNINISEEIQKMINGTTYIEEDTTYNEEISNVPVKYIFLPLGKSELEPVQYIENKMTDNQVYVFNNSEYVIDREVIFYTDYKSEKDIANKFAGHLAIDEIIKFSNRDDKTVRFLVYKEKIKEKNDEASTQFVK